MSSREIDSRGEKAIGVFLDKYFYAKAQEERIIAYAERIYDKNLQMKGIDVLVNRQRKVDEKAQIHYINRPLESFAFEINYYNEEKGFIVDGWFVSHNNETEDYLLLWIDSARTDQIYRIVSEDFECVTADLISKIHLRTYMEKLGINEQLLKKKAHEMRGKDIERIDLNEEIYLKYSNRVHPEKPINIVVKKSVLDNISTSRFRIRKDGITVLK